MTNTYDKEQNTKVSFLFPRVLTERMDELSVRIGVSRSTILRKSTQEYLNFLENEYQRNNTHQTT
jgi:predicted DNA-binding protein